MRASSTSSAGRVRPSRLTGAVVASVVAVTAALLSPVTATAADTDPFTIVLIPDTQNYTYSNRTAFLNGQMDWIISSRASLNTQFVAHLGDLVSEYQNATQWGIISTAMKKLDDAGIPNSVLPGNHDFDTTTRAIGPYDTYFPTTRYSQATWNSPTVSYGGYLGQNQFGADGVDRKNMDNYALLTAGGHDFLILNLEFEAPSNVLSWADRVMAAYPDRTVIMVTHSFINIDGSRRTTAQSTGGTAPSVLWSNFVATHCQIRMVLSGHEHNGDLGEANRTDNNSCGEPVHQMVSDYQDRANGGNGWLRYLTFDPVAGTVAVKTYSTALQQFETDASSQFTLPFPLDGEPPANVAPVADIAVLSTNGLTVDLSGTASRDVDGSIATYAWNLGDGTTASGATTSRTYAQAGTYTVQLTVTDDDGASDTITRAVTVTTAPPPTQDAVASDAFSRTLASGWGTADVGGAWTVPSGAAQLSVTGGSGVFALSPSWTREARLNAVSGTSTITDVQVSSNVVPLGGAASATVIGRLASNGDNYAARVRFEPGGILRLYLIRGETSLAGAGYVAPGSYAAGQVVNVRLSARGTNPTTLAAKIWKVGSAEPANWQLQATDSTAGLQAAGVVAIRTSLSAGSTSPTVRLAFDNLAVSTGQAPPANVAPVARFTSTSSGLTLNVNGTTSTDSDGTIQTYAWTFGATGTATGPTASYTFATGGTYPVALTVTDNAGATHTTTQNITVTAPPPVGVLAADGFARTVASGWGTADTGGAWTTVGAAGPLSVSGGQGVMTLPRGETREARLEGFTTTNAVVSIGLSSNVASAGGAASVTLIGREVGTSWYGARARLEPGGVMRMYLLRDESALGTFVLPGSYSPGQVLNVKVSVTGTSPTTVRGKIWLAGTPEPAAWQATGTDSTAAMQVAGKIAVRSSISGSSTVPTTVLRFDDLSATAP